MLLENQYQLMAQYNQWMNQKLYKVCTEVSDDIRKKDVGLFFKSIHSTLNHILYGDRAWLGRFQSGGQTPEGLQMGQDLLDDFVQLQIGRKKTDQDILEWVDTLDEQWLRKPFSFVSQGDGKKRTMIAWYYVVHMFNHQTHHRGQITAALSQLGFNYGSTDIPWMPELT